MEPMIYDQTFNWLEGIRWNLNKDIPWHDIDRSKLTDGMVEAIDLAMRGEFTTLYAARMFLRDFEPDIDFCSFMSVWYYEEMKHHFAFRRYLETIGYPVKRPELEAIPGELPAGGMINTTVLHMLGEIKLFTWYQHSANIFTEPVLQQIFRLIAGDELRHGKTYFRYLSRWISQDPAVKGKVLRMSRYLIREEQGSTIKHAVPLLVSDNAEFSFARTFANVFKAQDMDSAHKKAEEMGFRWLSKLSGYPIKSTGDLVAATRAEQSLAIHGQNSSTTH